MMPSMHTIISICFLLSYFLSPATSTHHFSPGTTIASSNTNTDTNANANPFSMKVALVQYWSQKIHNDYPQPSFLLSKASPLSAADATFYEHLAEKHSLAPHLRDFCGAANLVCYRDLSPSLNKKGSNAMRRAFFYHYFPRYHASGKKRKVATGSGKHVNSVIEPGVFFGESMLKTGTVMPMPDIQDKMATRSFLPRSISAKMPFSTTRIDELNRVFNTTLDTSMSKSMAETIADCERASSSDETKICATSMEDMIDFAVSVLGSNVVVWSTESVQGSKGHIMIGGVHGINGGKATKSVSCHQSMFPYMVYYCHSVPKVRVYQAEILDVGTHKVINHGVAICHIDTSNWSASHMSFKMLESAPGKIEVCHWIYEGDMTWAVAD